MRFFTRRSVALGLVLLAAAAAVAARPQLKKARVYLSGSVVPEGSRTLTSAGHDSLWVSVEGRRWATSDRQESAAAYYALVIPPPGRVRSDGSVTRSDGFSHSHTLKWASETDLGGGAVARTGGSLTISYDAVGGDVTFGPDAYALSKGNLFVVRLDEEWRPRVTQLGESVGRVDGFDAAREAVRRALPQDETARRF